MTTPGSEYMGDHLRRTYGKDLVSVGFLRNRKSDGFGDEEGSSESTDDVSVAPKGSLEAVFAEAGLEVAVVDLRSLPSSAVSKYFNAPVKMTSSLTTLLPWADVENPFRDNQGLSPRPCEWSLRCSHCSGWARPFACGPLDHTSLALHTRILSCAPSCYVSQMRPSTLNHCDFTVFKYNLMCSKRVHEISNCRRSRTWRNRLEERRATPQSRIQDRVLGCPAIIRSALRNGTTSFFSSRFSALGVHSVSDAVQAPLRML
ncbi:MAG: erythromycin esterase family protein [Phycisphaerales bacterium]|nr:MAG: erythromycin esterase family protein [Phycisphaerales bacterium]